MDMRWIPRPPSRPNLGAAALRALIGPERGAASAMARKCGIDAGTLSRLLGEDRAPGLAVAVRIRDATGIPVEAWTTPRYVEPTPSDATEVGAA